MIGLLAGMMLGFGMMSDAEREKVEEQARLDEMRALLGILEWHFALSWDWEPYTATYVASNMETAWDMMRADIVKDGGDPSDDKHRVYGVIRGGESVSLDYTPVYSKTMAPQARPVILGPVGVPIHFLWQVEREIASATVIPEIQKTMLEIEDEAWANVGKAMHEETASSLGGDGRYSADLIVVGGTVVFVGAL